VSRESVACVFVSVCGQGPGGGIGNPSCAPWTPLEAHSHTAHTDPWLCANALAPPAPPGLQVCGAAEGAR
jgi:hypothetical protein